MTKDTTLLISTEHTNNRPLTAPHKITINNLPEKLFMEEQTMLTKTKLKLNLILPLSKLLMPKEEQLLLMILKGIKPRKQLVKMDSEMLTK